MSGVRRTEEFLSVKTRELNIHNPDGSFPAQGRVLSFVDGYGTLEPSNDITLSSITARQINTTGTILQSNIDASDISAATIHTDTMTVNGRLVAPDISSNNIMTNLLVSQNIMSDCITSTRLYTPTLQTTSFVADDISASTISTTSFSADVINSANTSITTVNANTVTSSVLNTTVLNANIAYASAAKVLDISAQKLSTALLKVSDISANTLGAKSLSVTGDLSTNNFNATGKFIFDNLSLNTLTTKRIVSTDVSTNSVSSRTTAFPSMTIQTFDVSQINISGVLSAENLQSSVINVNSLTSSNISVGNIAVSGLSRITGNIIAQNASPVTINTPSTYTANTYRTTAINIDASMNINGGIISYDVSSGLLVDGQPISVKQALYPIPFDTVVPVNNLVTVTDISNTLLNFVDSFNNFMNIFSSRALVIILSPEYLLLSPLSMGFILNGGALQTVTIPIGNYSLIDIINRLNATSSPTIVFTPSYIKDPNNYQSYLWTVRFDVSGGNSSIADGPTNSVYTPIVPTGSLTLLRYLGFTVDTSNNPFETYTLGTNGIYYSTVYNISGSFISTNKLNITTEYPNNLPIPDCSYNLSDPYSISFRLANISSLAKFLCINQAGLGYSMYPLITTAQTIYNLIPNTPYTISAFYLDNYNQSSPAVSTLTTTRIPAPTITVVKTFNSISLNWSQPYPGKVYKFELDASGTFITPPQISFYDLSYTYFPLLRNTRYVIMVYSVDNAFRSAPTIIDLSTNVLTLNPPTVARIPNSNASILVTWPAITPGAVGTLYYRYGTSELLSYPDISNALTSFTVTGLGNSGVFSCYLVYTDYRYNVDLSSSVTTFPFNSGFGFENLLANAALPLVLDNVDTFGIGYAPGLGSIWVGYAINKISFPQGITEISGNNVSFVARAYDIPTSSLLALYSSPPWKNRITLPAPISTSTVFDLSAGTTAYPDLLFNTTEIILKGNTALTTIILLQKVSGLGRIQFSTFENNPPNPEQSPFATALTYDGDQFLSNGFQTSLYGAICQFTNTISVPKPTYTAVSTPYTITLQLTNLAPSQVSTVIVDISGVTTTYPNTQTTIVLSGLYPGNTYNTKVTYKNTFFTNETVAVLSTNPIPPPVNLTVTTLTSNTVRLNWDSGIPSRNYQFRLTASGASITPTNTTISATTFTYSGLVQNTQYTINVATYDTSFNIFSTPVVVTPKTLLIAVPSVVISRQANTNRKIQFTWSPSIPVGLSGYLYYTIGATNTNVGPIPSGSSSFLLPSELNFTTNVSSYLNYRDGQNNNVNGSVTNFVYDPSFGFYNLSPSSPTPLVLNSATIGVGYVLPAAGSPWIGFKMNTVSFPQGITETTGNAVAIVASIYSIPTNSLSYVGGGLYNNPFVAPNTGTINLPSPVNQSYIYFLDAGATAYPTLSFGSTQTLTNPVTSNFSLVLLIQIVDGKGNVRFSTFENVPALNIGSLATAITYDGRIFSNTLLGPSANGSICQFSFQYVPNAPFPPLLQNGVTKPNPYTLQYILTNLSTYTSYVSLNGALSPKGTATTITLDGLIPVSQYNLVIYYADTSGSSFFPVSATTSAVGSPSPLTITNLTYSTLTASWATVAYSGRNIRYVITNTGPFSPGTDDLATTTRPYTNLLNGSPYSISVYAYDVSYNSSLYWSAPVSQAVSTPALSVAITSINLVPNSNTSVRIQWAPALSSGLTGTLFYTVGGTPYSNAITGSTVSFTITGLTTALDISAAVVYTDGNRNTVTSAPVVFQYDPSFGFSSRSSITPRLSLNSTTIGLGYVLPAGSPWINYSVSSISFPQGITETLGRYVALIANVYTVATSSLSGLYTGGGTVSGLTLSVPDTSSNIFFLEPSTTATPVLTFASPITLLNSTNTTIVLLQIIDGLGNIEFATFNSTSTEAATSISYVGTTLTNRFITGSSGSGVICQFDLIPSPALPVAPAITNLTAGQNTISYTLTNLPTNTVNYVSLNNAIISNGTLTAITITGLNSFTVYNIRFYYVSGTTIYSTSVSYNSIKTIGVVPPTNLVSSNITFNSFNLSWTPVSGTTVGYLLSGTGANITSPGKTYDANYIFSGLSGNTVYSNIKLYAYNVDLNTAVATWRDKSGNKRHMANSGNVAYVYGPKPSIKFNSSYMFVNTPVNLQSYTLFVVSSCVPAINNQSLFAARPTGTGNYSYTGTDSFDMYVDSDIARMRFYYNSYVFLSQSIPSTSGFAMPLNLMTYTCTDSGAASSYYNGVAGTTGTSQARATTAQGFAVGASWNKDITQWSSSNTQANLYEVIAYNTVISDIQRIATTLYLGRKWNLPGFTSLPAIITTPTAISGLQIWYDGVDPAGNGSVPYDGTAITTWVNKASTGSQFNAVNSGTATPAVYSTSLKGVQFNGTNLYSTEYPANPTAETLFIAFNNNGATGWALLGGYEGARGFAPGNDPNVTSVGFLKIGILWQAQTPVGSYKLGTTAIATGQVSDNTTFASVNGAAFTSVAGTGLPYTAGTKTFLGQQLTGPQAVYNYAGCAMEILIYNRALSSTEIQQVQNYLTLKWGGATPTEVPSCQLWLDANDINTIVTTSDANPDANQAVYSEAVALPSSITTTSFPAVTLTLANTSNAYTSVRASWTPPLPAKVTGTLNYVRNTVSPQRSFPGCILWLDSADNSTLKFTNNVLTSWADKSGRGNNIIPTGTITPPSTISAGIVMSNARFNTSLVVPSQSHCLIAVHNPITNELGTSLFWFEIASGTYTVFPYKGRGYVTSFDPTGSITYNGTLPLPENSINTSSPYNIIIANISANSQKIYRNGILQSSATAPLNGVNTGPLTIGSLFNGAEAYAGTIYELYVYNTTLTEAQITQLSIYLQNKWSNILSFPSSSLGAVQYVSLSIPQGASSYTIPVSGNTVIGCDVIFTDGVNNSTATSNFRNYVSPMASQIASRIGVSPFAGTTSQATTAQSPLLWRCRTGGYVYTPPVIGLDGTIYVGDVGGFFNAINPDGTKKWAVTCVAMYPGPAIDAVSGNIYTNDSLNIRALNPVDGTEVWKRSDIISGSTIVIGPTGAIYVGTLTSVISLNGQTGATLWTFDMTGSFAKTGAAVGSDGTIYIGSADFKLYAIRDNGTAKWEYSTGAAIIATPVVGTDGTICFGSNDTYIYALTSAGALKWRYKTGDGIAVTPVIGPDGSVYVGSKDFNFYALTSTGTLKWRYSTDDGIYTSAVLDNTGIIYFGSNDKYVTALNAATGSIVWRYAMGGGATGSPTLGVDGTVYIGSGDYFLYAFKGYFNTNTPSVIQNLGTSLALRYATVPSIYDANMVYSLNGGANVSVPIKSTPPSTNLEVWYDGADPLATGTLPANGASISTWKNKASTGTTYDAVASTPATYSLANKSLLFTTDKKYSTGYTSKPVSETVFIVFNTDGTLGHLKNRILATNDGGSRCITVGSSNSAATAGTPAVLNSVGMINQNVFYQVSTPANSYISNTTSIGTFTVSGQGITTTASVNGANKTSYTSASAYYSNVTTILGNIGGSGYEGYAMEILIYSRVLSDTEISETQSYLFNKWLGGVPVAVTYPPQRIYSYVVYKSPAGSYFYYSPPFIYGGGWATFQNNNTRTSQSPNSANVPTNPKWVYNAGTGTISSPLIDSNNNVLFSHSSGRVYSLKGSDGTLVWQVNPGANSSSQPALDFNGNFYTSTTAGTIVKMSGVTGGVLWISSVTPGGVPWPGTGYSITSGLTIDETSGYIYFALSTNRIYAIGANGAYVWVTNYTDYQNSTCSINKITNEVYCGSNYFGFADIRNASTGTFIGSFESGTWSSGTTSFSTVIIGPDQTVYVTGNFVSGGTTVGRVTRYSQDRTVVYNYTNPNPLGSGPALGTNGLLYHIYPNIGYVVALNSTGNVVIAYNGQVVISTSLALDVNNNAYFGNTSGYLSALSPTGALLWSYQLPNGDYPVGTPVIGRDGTIYIGSNLGYMYAL